MRYIGVGTSLVTYIASVLLRLLDANAAFDNNMIMLYMFINTMSLAFAFVLTKKIVMNSKMNLVVVTFWVYFFGFFTTVIIFLF